MAYQPLEKLLKKANNSIYSLVLMASKRATELAEGMPKLIERPAEIKTTTLALDEILEGKVELRRPNDPVEEPQETAKARDKDEDKEEVKAEA